MKLVDASLRDAIVAKTHPPRYRIHKFWARKPHNVIANYIEHFTDPGDIVLDPFCGSGVTICESLHAGRKAIGVDLNPIAVFITRLTSLPLDIAEFDQAVGWIGSRLANATEQVYATTCPDCGRTTEATHYVWTNQATCERCALSWPTDESNRRGGFFYCPQCGHPLPRGDFNQEKLVRVLAFCKCGNKGRLKEKEPDALDAVALAANRLDSVRPEFSIPLTVNTRHDVFPGMTLGSLFTDRAQQVLSALRRLIDECPFSQSAREFLLLAFTASLAQSSRLHSIDFRPGRAYRSRGWTVPSYWIASGHFEQNARLSFVARCAKLRKGKIDSNAYVPAELCQELHDFLVLQQAPAGFLTTCSSAKALHSIIPDNSVDYVFSDPPYGDSITYLELSEIWNAWLGLPGSSAYTDEVVISDAEGRQKTLQQYQHQLRECFDAVHRVLRPGAWMSLTFHNRNIAVWNALLNAAVESHFDFIDDVYQLPAMASAKSGSQRSGSMTGDVVLNFRKPVGVPSRLRAGQVDVEKLVVDEARQIIAERRGTATEDQLMRGVVHVLLRHGVVDQTSDDIRKVLARYLDRTPKGDWLLNDDNKAQTLLDYIPIEKRILWLIESQLASGPATLDDILRRIFTTLKNGRTPEAREISQVLDLVALPMPDGKWRTRTEDDAAVQLRLGELLGVPARDRDDEAEALLTHDQFVRIIAEWAIPAGYSPWIGKTEQGHDPKLRTLSLPRLSIPGLTQDAISQNRIDEIDVIWLRDAMTPFALFEIEHTTRAMTCIPRMGNLTRLLPHLALDVFIVAADGLKSHISRQIAAPSSQAILKGHHAPWFFLPYTEVLRLSEDYRQTGSTPSLEHIRNAAELIG